MPDGSREQYAIVIDLPDPQLSCFLAFPFSLHPLVNSIDEAARRAELQTYRIDFETLGRPFIDDIVSKTRGARMVIALCTPEHASHQPNPNVMYELGMAHALGKPSLTVTTDTNTLPADIRHYSAFVYDPNQLNDEEGRKRFVAELSAAILKIQHNVRPDRPLVLDGVKDVWVAKASDRMILTKCFWQYAKAVIGLAHDVRVEGRFLHLNHLNEIVRAANQILNREAKWEVCGHLLELWGKYRSDHMDRLNPVFGPARRAAVQECIDRLNENSPGGTDDVLSMFTADYGRLKEMFEDYNTQLSVVDQQIIPATRDWEQRANFYLQVVTLRDSLVNLERRSNLLIENLILNVCEMFHEAGPARAATVSGGAK